MEGPGRLATPIFHDVSSELAHEATPAWVGDVLDRGHRVPRLRALTFHRWT
ncbi:hypothetical protein AAII07_11895 [Microvirga sp. 0TCS3.31]